MVKLIKSEPENTTVVRQVVLKAIFETPVFVTIQKAGRIQVFSFSNVPKCHAYMTSKDIMDAYPGRPFYITIASFGKGDAHLPSTKELAKSQMHLMKLFTLKTIVFCILPAHMRMIATAQSMLYTTSRPRIVWNQSLSTKP